MCCRETGLRIEARTFSAVSDETAEKVDFAGGDSIDTETRPPYGRAAALRAAVEANMLPRNGPANSGRDFFSGLRRRRTPAHVERPPVSPPFGRIGAARIRQVRGSPALSGCDGRLRLEGRHSTRPNDRSRWGSRDGMLALLLSLALAPPPAVELRYELGTNGF